METWLKELGADKSSVRAMGGGLNNDVFFCREKNGPSAWVIKHLPLSDSKDFDRFKAEVEFLKFVEVACPKRAPRLVCFNEDERYMVLEHIDGQRFSEGSAVSKKDIIEACMFFQELNSDRDLANKMVSMRAADGFKCLSEHMENVRARRENMGTGHLPNEVQLRLGDVLARISRAVGEEYEFVEREVKSGNCEDDIDEDLLRLSPSDFGFHNSLRTKLGIVFLDFEFAGWDDPTKTLIDFELQPRASIRREWIIKDCFWRNKAERFQRRYEILRRILILKWACIALWPSNWKKFESRIKNLSIDEQSISVSRAITKAEDYLSLL
jgi:hypothetical protein